MKTIALFILAIMLAMPAKANVAVGAEQTKQYLPLLKGKRVALLSNHTGIVILGDEAKGRKGAKAENRPGVTRGKQWVTVDNSLLLLDTPGILWPKFEDTTVGEHLAFTGAVNDRVVDVELLAVRLLEILCKDYPEILLSRYGELCLEDEPYEILEQVGRKRGMVVRGGEIDTVRASNMLLEEYRNLKIGKISLERIENA